MITIETTILNRTSGSENDMWFSNETTGVVCIVALALLRFITNDMQKEISVRNQSNGSFQFASLVMTPGTTDFKKKYVPTPFVFLRSQIE